MINYSSKMKKRRREKKIKTEKRIKKKRKEMKTKKRREEKRREVKREEKKKKEKRKNTTCFKSHNANEYIECYMKRSKEKDKKENGAAKWPKTAHVFYFCD